MHLEKPDKAGGAETLLSTLAEQEMHLGCRSAWTVSHTCHASLPCHATFVIALWFHAIFRLQSYTHKYLLYERMCEIAMADLSCFVRLVFNVILIRICPGFYVVK